MGERECNSQDSSDRCRAYTARFTVPLRWSLIVYCVPVFRSTTHRTMSWSGRTPSSRARSSKSTPRRSANGTNRTTPSQSQRSSLPRLLPLPPPTRVRRPSRSQSRATSSANSRQESRMRRSTRCWRLSLVRVGCMRLFRVGRDRLVERMGTFLKGKSWRYVLLQLTYTTSPLVV